MRERILASIDKVVSEMDTYQFDDLKSYSAWASQAYYFVRHSTPMLALSCGLSVENRPYHIRCIEHLAEEKGHDKMLMNDMKANGFEMSKFPELSSTQALYQTQYYWIMHKSPTSFLGYIMLLEGLAVKFGEKLNVKVAPHKGKSFIKVHSDDDIEHLDKAFAALEALTENERELVAQNAALSADLYIGMLKELKAQPSLVA